MKVEISYKCSGIELLTRTLIREFADDLSEDEVRDAVIWEIVSDMGLVSYEFRYK